MINVGGTAGIIPRPCFGMGFLYCLKMKEEAV